MNDNIVKTINYTVVTVNVPGVDIKTYIICGKTNFGKKLQAIHDKYKNSRGVKIDVDVRKETRTMTIDNFLKYSNLIEKGENENE